MDDNTPTENQQQEPATPVAPSPSPAPQRPTPPPAPAGDAPAEESTGTVTTMQKTAKRSYKPVVILVMVLALIGAGGVFGFLTGFTFDVSRFFAAEEPTVNVQCRSENTFGEGPCIVSSGTDTDVMWESTNAVTCTASGDWSGDKGLNASESTGNVTTDSTFILTCMSADGREASDSVTVEVQEVAVGLTCAPDNESVDSGDKVIFAPIGSGSGDYSWRADDGDPVQGTGTSFEVTFEHEGMPVTKDFDVQMFDNTVDPASGSEPVSCSVSVKCAAPVCEDVPVGCTRVNANACECGEVSCESDTSTSADEMTCSPSRTSADVDEEVTLEVEGGSGVYSWSSPDGDRHTSQTGSEYVVSYPRTGGYTVTVNDGQAHIAQCVVNVTEPADTPRPTEEPETGDVGLALEKMVRNVSRGSALSDTTPASPGEIVEFIIAVNSTGNDEALGVVLADVMHVDLEFMPSTATINGSPVSAIVGQPGAGPIAQFEYTIVFVAGDLDAGDRATLKYQARVSDHAGIPGTNVDLMNVGGAVTSDALVEATDTAVVIVVGLIAGTATPSDTPGATTSPVGDAAQVETGPGQATVLALVISAIATLLYIGYTSTSMFRRREAAGYARGSGHPDFRNH